MIPSSACPPWHADQPGQRRKARRAMPPVTPRNGTPSACAPLRAGFDQYESFRRSGFRWVSSCEDEGHACAYSRTNSAETGQIRPSFQVSDWRMSGGKPVLRDASHRSAPGSHAGPSRQSRNGTGSYWSKPALRQVSFPWLFPHASRRPERPSRRMGKRPDQPEPTMPLCGRTAR